MYTICIHRRWLFQRRMGWGRLFSDRSSREANTKSYRGQGSKRGHNENASSLDETASRLAKATKQPSVSYPRDSKSIKERLKTLVPSSAGSPFSFSSSLPQYPVAAPPSDELSAARKLVYMLFPSLNKYGYSLDNYEHLFDPRTRTLFLSPAKKKHAADPSSPASTVSFPHLVRPPHSSSMEGSTSKEIPDDSATTGSFSADRSINVSDLLSQSFRPIPSPQYIGGSPSKACQCEVLIRKLHLLIYRTPHPQESISELQRDGPELWDNLVVWNDLLYMCSREDILKQPDRSHLLFHFFDQMQRQPFGLLPNVESYSYVMEGCAVLADENALQQIESVSQQLRLQRKTNYNSLRSLVVDQVRNPSPDDTSIVQAPLTEAAPNNVESDTAYDLLIDEHHLMLHSRRGSVEEMIKLSQKMGAHPQVRRSLWQQQKIANVVLAGLFNHLLLDEGSATARQEKKNFLLEFFQEMRYKERLTFLIVTEGLHKLGDVNLINDLLHIVSTESRHPHAVPLKRLADRIKAHSKTPSDIRSALFVTYQNAQAALSQRLMPMKGVPVDSAELSSTLLEIASGSRDNRAGVLAAVEYFDCVRKHANHLVDKYALQTILNILLANLSTQPSLIAIFDSYVRTYLDADPPESRPPSSIIFDGSLYNVILQAYTMLRRHQEIQGIFRRMDADGYKITDLYTYFCVLISCLRELDLQFMAAVLTRMKGDNIHIPAAVHRLVLQAADLVDRSSKDAPSETVLFYFQHMIDNGVKIDLATYQLLLHFYRLRRSERNIDLINQRLQSSGQLAPLLAQCDHDAQTSDHCSPSSSDSSASLKSLLHRLDVQRLNKHPSQCLQTLSECQSRLDEEIVCPIMQIDGVPAPVIKHFLFNALIFLASAHNIPAVLAFYEKVRQRFGLVETDSVYQLTLLNEVANQGDISAYQFFHTELRKNNFLLSISFPITHARLKVLAYRRALKHLRANFDDLSQDDQTEDTVKEQGENALTESLYLGRLIEARKHLMKLRAKFTPFLRTTHQTSSTSIERKQELVSQRVTKPIRRLSSILASDLSTTAPSPTAPSFALLTQQLLNLTSPKSEPPSSPPASSSEQLDDLIAMLSESTRSIPTPSK